MKTKISFSFPIILALLIQTSTWLPFSLPQSANFDLPPLSIRMGISWPGRDKTELPNEWVWATIVYSLRPRQSTDTNGIYVSPNGDDDNPGTFEQPFKTIKKAASIVNAGDIVYVRSGSYVEKVDLYRSGTEAARIRFSAYPGEIPVIDGQGIMGENWGVLLDLTGDYIEVSGFEVKNSAGMCVRLAGKHNRASQIVAHHCDENGILITGDFGIVEDSEVWWAASSHAYGSGSSWASGISAARSPRGAIIRRNYVHDNWGEGLSTFEATETIIEDNTIRDSWSANLYVSDATHVLVQNNTVYTTEDSEVQTGTRVGIMLGDEKCLPCSSDITIINNHVYKTERNFYWWQGVSDGMVNTTITGNVFEESINVAGVQINSGNHVNSVFENNTIIQTNGLPPLLNYGNVPGENTIVAVQAPAIPPSSDVCQTNCSQWWEYYKSFCFLQCLRNFIRTIL